MMSWKYFEVGVLLWAKLKFSRDYENRFLNKTKKDFVIDFDNVWKWLRFTRKDHAKRLLEKNFTIDIDYQVIKHKPAPPSCGAGFEDLKSPSINLGGAGLNKEQMKMKMKMKIYMISKNKMNTMFLTNMINILKNVYNKYIFKEMKIYIWRDKKKK